MRRKTKIWLILATLSLAGCSFGRHKDNSFDFKEVGWRVTMPKGFDLVDSAQNAALNQRGAKALSEANNTEVSAGHMRTLFAARKGQLNYFSATIDHFDQTKDGDYIEITQQVKEMLYKTFAAQGPNAKIDTSTANIALDGVTFDRFEVTMILNSNLSVHSVLLSKLYKGYDFGISYVYVDKSTRTAIEDALRSSKFY